MRIAPAYLLSQDTETFRQMERENTIHLLRNRLQQWRQGGESIALVPTMGNLHAGHMALVARARQLADRVVVTVFVNPAQFGAGEDFSSYPRTISQDSVLLAEAEVDLLFTPEIEEMYPGGLDGITWVEVPNVSEELCGASRPGHFRGVATVVNKFFNCIQPDIAVYGEKDYQQLLVIRKMVTDLCMSVRIVEVPTVREADGLALSSRNTYLTDKQRRQAPLLYKLLLLAKKQILAGERNYVSVAGRAKTELRTGGFEPDYFEVRRADNLLKPASDCTELVILAAARLGQTRLIDNVILSL